MGFIPTMTVFLSCHWCSELIHCGRASYLNAVDILDQVGVTNGAKLFECVPGQGQLVLLTDTVEAENRNWRVVLLQICFFFKKKIKKKKKGKTALRSEDGSQ